MIRANGSAEFAGDINVNGGINSNGASILSDGRVYGSAVYAERKEGSSNSILFQGRNNGTEVFLIEEDGSADFAGAVTVGTTTSDSNETLKVGAKGSYLRLGNSDDGNHQIFALCGSTERKLVFLTTGGTAGGGGLNLELMTLRLN